jgi:outer membrane protein assembly factor BamB
MIAGRCGKGLLGAILLVSGLNPTPASSAQPSAMPEPARSVAPLRGQVNWPKFRFDLANTGFNPHETILNPSNVATLQQVWRAKAESSSASPAVVDGVIYQDSAYPTWSLYAFDAVTGAKRWKADLASAITGSSPAVAGGLVYVGTLSGLLYALDASTGAIVWVVQLDYQVSASPTVWNGAVYVGTYIGPFYALDGATGDTLWTAHTGGIDTSSAAVVNGVAYVGSLDNHLYAFDAETGSMLWHAHTGSSIHDSPAVANGIVYVGSQEHGLYAFDAVTGRIRWRQKLGGWILASSAAVANGIVYAAASSADKLYAFDAATGQQLWVVTTPASDASPAVANGVLYAGASERLCAFDALSGARLWCARIGAIFTHSPVVVNGMVYMPGGYSTDGRLFAFGLPGSG